MYWKKKIDFLFFINNCSNQLQQILHYQNALRNHKRTDGLSLERLPC